MNGQQQAQQSINDYQNSLLGRVSAPLAGQQQFAQTAQGMMPQQNNFAQDFAHGFAQGINPMTYINPFISGLGNNLNTPSNVQPQQGYFLGGSGTKVWVPTGNK